MTTNILREEEKKENDMRRGRKIQGGTKKDSHGKKEEKKQMTRQPRKRVKALSNNILGMMCRSSYLIRLNSFLIQLSNEQKKREKNKLKEEM